MQARHQKQILAARRSASAFIEYALRNEQNGSVIRNAAFQEEWQELLEENRFAVLLASVEHGKSTQIGVGKMLWLIGSHPNRRYAFISNTAEQAKKILRAIRTEIETNPRVREVFPNLKPSAREEDPWHSTQITVERTITSRDPTLQAMGVFGPLVGSRLDGAVLDDILDFENTRTEDQRKKVIEWIDTTVMTRIVEGGFLWAIGTPWHPEDALHWLEKRPDFVSKRFGAVLNPDEPPDRWIPRWPEQWPLKRILERRRNSVEATFVRKYLCRVRLDSMSRFREVWLDRMKRLGKGRTLLAEAPRAYARGPRLPCFTGVDLGVGKKESNAKTCIFTIALGKRGERLIVDIESGRWQAPEIIDRIASAQMRFDSEMLVENNGAQQFLIDMCHGRVSVNAFTTTAAKKFDEEWGVESLAVEMRNGWWVLPSGRDGETVHEEAHEWLEGLRHYDPETHTSDHVMASWLARECLRRYAAPRTRNLDSQAR